jgi:hypothetical protein
VLRVTGVELAISKVIRIMIVWIFTPASRNDFSSILATFLRLIKRTRERNEIGAFSDHNAVRRRCLIWADAVEKRVENVAEQ